jgi:hypothetical protein
MSILHNASRVILWLLIIAGLWGALRVSYTTITGTARCPDFMDIPICYLVGIGYLSMLAAQVATPGKVKNRLFYPAWALVFVIAAFGAGLEITTGNTCPRSNGGVPLCYFSFVLCVAIFLLYIFTSKIMHWRSGLTD